MYIDYLILAACLYYLPDSLSLSLGTHTHFLFLSVSLLCILPPLFLLLHRLLYTEFDRREGRKEIVDDDSSFAPKCLLFVSSVSLWR